MKLAIKRAERVSDLIRIEISDIILREIKDPGIGPVTITGVKMSDDLKLAKVYFVRLGSDEYIKEAEKHLQKAAGFLKRELGKRLSLRYIPDLFFIYDRSFEYGSRIDKLLSEIKKEEKADAEPDK